MHFFFLTPGHLFFPRGHSVTVATLQLYFYNSTLSLIVDVILNLLSPVFCDIIDKVDNIRSSYQSTVLVIEYHTPVPVDHSGRGH